MLDLEQNQSPRLNSYPGLRKKQMSITVDMLLDKKSTGVDLRLNFGGDQRNVEIEKSSITRNITGIEAGLLSVF